MLIKIMRVQKESGFDSINIIILLPLYNIKLCIKTFLCKNLVFELRNIFKKFGKESGYCNTLISIGTPFLLPSF